MSEIFDKTIWPAFSAKLRSAKSIVNYQAAIKEFSEFTGVSFELTTIKHVSDYEMYLTKLEQNDKKIKTSTHASKMFRLKSVADFIEECHLISDYNNPFRDIKIDTPEWMLSDKDMPLLHDLEILLESAKENTRDFLIFMLAAKCGLTTGEILNLTIDDLIFDENRKVISLNIRKPRFSRNILIPDDISNIISEYLSTFEGEKELFLNSRNKPVTEKYLQRLIGSYMDKLSDELSGRRMTLTDLRHAAIKYMKMGGASNEEIAAYIGNVNAYMLSRYDEVSYNNMEKGIKYSVLSVN